jgi:hypothetical protein
MPGGGGPALCVYRHGKPRQVEPPIGISAQTCPLVGQPCVFPFERAPSESANCRGCISFVTELAIAVWRVKVFARAKCSQMHACKLRVGVPPGARLLLVSRA